MISKSISDLKLPISYFTIGTAWIVFSDLLVSSDQAIAFTQAGELQSIKGILFVATTSVFLYFLSKLCFHKVTTAKQEKEAVYRMTAEGTQHILNNFLQKMLIFKVEAEQHQDFNRETLRLVNQIIEDAKDDVVRLTGLTELSEQSIHDTIYQEKREYRFEKQI